MTSIEILIRSEKMTQSVRTKGTAVLRNNFTAFAALLRHQCRLGFLNLSPRNNCLGVGNFL